MDFWRLIHASSYGSDKPQRKGDTFFWKVTSCQASLALTHFFPTKGAGGNRSLLPFQAYPPPPPCCWSPLIYRTLSVPVCVSAKDGDNCPNRSNVDTMRCPWLSSNARDFADIRMAYSWPEWGESNDPIPSSSYGDGPPPRVSKADLAERYQGVTQSSYDRLQTMCLSCVPSKTNSTNLHSGQQSDVLSIPRREDRGRSSNRKIDGNSP